MNYAANVISARARAMFGKSLTYDDYAAMMNCHSVSEIAAFLKNNTAYRTVLTDVNETTIHRGYLESRLRRRLWDCYAALIRFDQSAGKGLSDYLLQKEETVQLMALLRQMNVGRSQEHILSLPAVFEGRTKLDLLAVNRAKSPAELIPALSGTAYEKLLEPFRDCENGDLPLTRMETALYTALSERMLDIIAHSDRTMKQEMTTLCGIQMDAQNVTRILRLKTYFHLPPEEIRPLLLPFSGAVPKRTWEAMLAAQPEEIPALFFATGAGRHTPPSHRPYTYDLPERAVYFTARHYMHFSTHPTVVLYSYLTIMETEVIDIINIIEGVRYQLPPEEIKPMLVLGLERL